MAPTAGASKSSAEGQISETFALACFQYHAGRAVFFLLGFVNRLGLPNSRSVGATLRSKLELARHPNACDLRRH